MGIAFISLYKRKRKEISVENLCLGINAKRAKGHDKLRVKDNQGLSQLYIDLGRVKAKLPFMDFGFTSDNGLLNNCKQIHKSITI